MKSQPLSPEHVCRYNIGLLGTELNTILKRVSRRHSGEPTARELARIQELQAKIRELRGGKADNA